MGDLQSINTVLGSLNGLSSHESKNKSFQVCIEKVDKATPWLTPILNTAKDPRLRARMRFSPGLADPLFTCSPPPLRKEAFGGAVTPTSCFPP